MALSRERFELTERGKTLIVPLHLLWTWAQANRTARVPAATSINSAARMGHLPDWCDAWFTQIGRFPSSTGPHEERRRAPLALLKRRFATTRDYRVEVRVRVGSIASF